MRHAAHLCMFLLAGLMLAGCLESAPVDVTEAEDGKNERDTPSPTPGESGSKGGSSGNENGKDPVSTSKGTGEIVGKVVDDAYEPVRNASLALRRVDSESGALTEIGRLHTTAEGKYHFDEVVTGTYRIHVTAACCRPQVWEISVASGETTTRDFRLDRLTETDLQRPYKVGPITHTGFIACAFRYVIGPQDVGVNACQATDPEEQRNFETEAKPGLKTLTVAVEWTSSGPTDAEELTLRVNPDTDFYLYGEMTGASPFLFRLEDHMIEDGPRRFANQTDDWGLRFRVNPGPTEGLVYQLEFTLHYALHYWEPAPEGYSPRPEG